MENKNFNLNDFYEFYKSNLNLIIPILNFSELEIPFYKSGNKINIKKKNRGKFTLYCGGNVTEECIRKGKNSSNPITRKRATFAANARAWKHSKGGSMSRYFSSYNPMVYKSTPTKASQQFRNSLLLLNDYFNPTSQSSNPVSFPQSSSLSSVYTPYIDNVNLDEIPFKYTNNKQYVNTPESIEEMFKDAGIEIEVTSGYREGATTKDGKPSRHSKKDANGYSLAFDIVPKDRKSYNKLKEIMLTNPTIRNWMDSNNFGILDETIEETLARTGGTAPHWHIGGDPGAIRTWELFKKEYEG